MSSGIKENRIWGKSAHGGASISEQSQCATQSPCYSSHEKPGEWVALYCCSLRDLEGIVTPLRAITLSKALLKSIEGQCIMVAERTWSSIKKCVTSVGCQYTYKWQLEVAVERTRAQGRWAHTKKKDRKRQQVEWRVGTRRGQGLILTPLPGSVATVSLSRYQGGGYQQWSEKKWKNKKHFRESRI